MTRKSVLRKTFTLGRSAAQTGTDRWEGGRCGESHIRDLLTKAFNPASHMIFSSDKTARNEGVHDTHIPVKSLRISDILI